MDGSDVLLVCIGYATVIYVLYLLSRPWSDGGQIASDAGYMRCAIGVHHWPEWSIVGTPCPLCKHPLPRGDVGGGEY
jgi:hypothetical protein